MDDLELLELAAKAAGIRTDFTAGGKIVWNITDESNHKLWNPLTDDGDALRLAVKLKIDVYQSSIYEESCAVGPMGKVCTQLMGDDPAAATRRAIVRAAAEIGRTMKEPA